MGWKKRIKRKIKHVKKVIKYANPKTAYKSAAANIKKTTGGGSDDYDDASEMADARSLAAQKVIKDQQRQAGGGQVSFSSESYA